jgi:plasmid replication initiation protein
MKKELYDMLLTTAEADKKQALLSLELLSNEFVEGIEDNAREALQLLVDAECRINTLEKYFTKSKRVLYG